MSPDDPGTHRATGPNSEVAMATAEALGAMPLRARVASATADELGKLDLPAAGLKAEDAPRRWRA